MSIMTEKYGLKVGDKIRVIEGNSAFGEGDVIEILKKEG